MASKQKQPQTTSFCGGKSGSGWILRTLWDGAGPGLSAGAAAALTTQAHLTPSWTEMCPGLGRGGWVLLSCLVPSLFRVPGASAEPSGSRLALLPQSTGECPIRSPLPCSHVHGCPPFWPPAGQSPAHCLCLRPQRLHLQHQGSLSPRLSPEEIQDHFPQDPEVKVLETLRFSGSLEVVSAILAA